MKHYPAAVKQHIVSQYTGGQSVRFLSAQYEIPKSTIYSWIKTYQPLCSSDHDPGNTLSLKDYNDLKRYATKLENILQIIRISGCTPDSPLEDRISAFRNLRDRYSATELCEALNICKGTYHNRIIGETDPTYYALRKERLSHQVKEVFEESQQRYGADKILAVLQSKGIRTSKKYVLKLMHEMGLESIAVQSKKVSASLGRKQNILQRQFTANAPNQIWVSDVTACKIKDHYYFICVIIDLFSRKVISHKITLHNSTQLITATFLQAFVDRGEPQNLIFHSDRGSPYVSNRFRSLLQQKGVTQSFSKSGSPHDNAVSESFFALLKREETHRRIYTSERIFRKQIEQYISFYNTERPHRHNGYKPPDQVEQAFAEAQSHAS